MFLNSLNHPCTFCIHAYSPIRLVFKLQLSLQINTTSILFYLILFNENVFEVPGVLDQPCTFCIRACTPIRLPFELPLSLQINTTYIHYQIKITPTNPYS